MTADERPAADTKSALESAVRHAPASAPGQTAIAGTKRGSSVRKIKPKRGTDPVSQFFARNEQDLGNDEAITGSFPVVRRKDARRGSSFSPRSRKSGIKITDKTRSDRLAAFILIFLMSIVIGFSYMAQTHSRETSYESLSEDELVRLLDETNSQISKLTLQKESLAFQLESIRNSVNKQSEIERLAKEKAQVSGIASGRLAAYGPGIVATISQGNSKNIDAATMYTLINELRNAGAEAIELGTVRAVTSTYVVDTVDGIECDGTKISFPVTVKAIGDASALQNALQISGGVGSRLRVQFGATLNVSSSDNVEINSTHETGEYRYAKILE